MEKSRPQKTFEPSALPELTVEDATKRRLHPSFLKGVEGVVTETIEYIAALEESKRFENDPLFYDDNPLAQKLVRPFGVTQPRQDPHRLLYALGRLTVRRPSRIQAA